MSASVPGPKARSIARPARHALGRVSGGSSCPSQDSVEAHRGLEVVQAPSFEARTMRPAADSVVSTRGPTGIRPPHDFPSP